MAEKALAKSEPKEEIAFVLKLTTAERNLIKQSVAPDSTTEEFGLFIYDCQMRGLNPLKKEIYFVKRAGKATHQVSIDGFRIIAQRTGEYQGQTKVEFSEDQVQVGDLSAPEFAEVGVWRNGFKEPVVARAYFDEFKQEFKGKLGTMWAKMPRHMLSKCAESLALRKAFPDTLAGIYTTEEMGVAEMEEKAVETGDIQEVEGWETDEIDAETGEVIEPKKKPVKKSFEDVPDKPEF
jgi:phage recombination protein Bet